MSVARPWTGPPRGRLNMAPDELRGLPDHELILLLHERYEVLRKDFDRFVVMATPILDGVRSQQSVRSWIREYLPWVGMLGSLVIAGHAAHYW